MLKQIRQGDVLLEVVSKEPPKNLEVKEQAILAEGELTGHAHRVRGQVVEWAENDRRFFRVIGNAFGKLSHEDHDPAPVKVIEPNVTYEIIPQKELSLKGQWEKVVD